MTPNGLSGHLPAEVQTKLFDILASKAQRGGKFCLQFARENLPFDIRNMFSGYKRYVLEVGCGWGEFTRAYARQNPETLVIAIEKKLARVIASGRKQQTEGLCNIRYLVLDVAWFFDGVFAAEQFDAVTINFPDPWPKARHHKHRFVSPDFAESLRQIARSNATLTFATDNYPYAREAMRIFEESPHWQNLISPYIALGDIEGRPRSYFEMLHRAEGAPIYFLQYTRR